MTLISQLNNSEYIHSVYLALKSSGIAICNIEKSNYSVRTKSDLTPVTEADLESDRIICEALLRMYPTIPVISEETFSNRTINSDKFWLLDPLDGTKEFIAGNGEYCISLALIENAQPIEAYIFAPRSDEFWFAKKNHGAYKLVNNKFIKLTASKSEKGPLLLLRSRSHHNSLEENWYNRISEDRKINIEVQGSAIKFCRIAEGMADLYIKKGNIYSWDIAAGNLILRESGGDIIAYPDGKQIQYLSTEFKMPFFLAYSFRIKKPQDMLI